MPNLKVTKIESCQSWKWFLYFLLKINSFDELKVAKFESYQLWKLPILKVAKVESCQNWEWFSISFWKLLSYQVAKLPICQITKLPNCQVAKLPSCQIAKLLNCQIAKWPSGQIAKLQVAKLWTCDHGAKSLSFLLKLNFVWHLIRKFYMKNMNTFIKLSEKDGLSLKKSWIILYVTSWFWEYMHLYLAHVLDPFQ